MDDDDVMFMLAREAARQCLFARLALDDLFLSMGEPRTDEKATRIWANIQAFLTACAALSRLLWPAPDAHVDHSRRARLRGSLGIEDSSPLWERTARNYLEHYDEKLEQWLDRESGQSIADNTIGPVSHLKSFHGQGIRRNFDPNAGVVTLAGETYDLRALDKATAELLPRLKLEEILPPWAKQSMRRQAEDEADDEGDR